MKKITKVVFCMLAISKEYAAVAGITPGDDTTIGSMKGTPMRTLDTLTHALRTQHGRHKSLLALLEANRLGVKHDRLLDTDRVAELDQRDDDLNEAAGLLDEVGQKWNVARQQRTTVTLQVLAERVDQIDTLLDTAESLITGTTPVPVPAPSPLPIVIPVPAPVAASGGSGDGGGDDDGNNGGGTNLDALLARAQEIIDELEGRTNEKFVKVDERIDGVARRVTALEDETRLAPEIVALLNGLGVDDIRAAFNNQHIALLAALLPVLPDNASIEDLKAALKLGNWTRSFKLPRRR